MITEEEMTIDERRKYLRRMKPRYVKATRQERSQLLDEMVYITNLDRKTLIRLLGCSLARQPRRRQCQSLLIQSCSFCPEVIRTV